MLRNLGVAVVILCLVSFHSRVSFAKGNGHLPTGGQGYHTRQAAFAPPRSAANDVFVPSWAAAGPGYGFPYGYGWGGAGYGAADWGWGYGWSDAGSSFPEHVPYFNLYPPVYYGYDSGAIAPRSMLRSSWMGGYADSANSVAPPAIAPPTPPLRIVNPYYTAEK